MRKYTNQDPETPKGQAILAVHFISQASPSIRQKLQKLEQGPQTPFPVLLDEAFKVFNNREEASGNRRELREEEKLKRHAQYMALAIAQSLPKQTHRSPSPVSETAAELLPVRSAGAQCQEPHHPIPRALTVTKRAIGRRVVPAALKRGGQCHNHPTLGAFRVPAPWAKVKANCPCRW